MSIRKGPSMQSRVSTICLFLATGGMLLFPQPNLLAQCGCGAQFGPCTQDSPSQSLNNGQCSGGTCTGQSTIIYATSSCKNQNEDECTNSVNQPQQTITPASCTFLGYSTVMSCLASDGLQSSCLLCIAATGVAGLVSGGILAIGVGTVCAAYCIGANALINQCCWNAVMFTGGYTINGVITCSSEGS